MPIPDVDNLHPQTALQWQGAQQSLDDAGLPYTLTSAYRSPEEQQDVWDRYQKGDPSIKLAAPPGHSNHERGTAIDVATPPEHREAVTGVMAQNGFKWFGPKDPVHYDTVGAPDARHAAQPSFEEGFMQTFAKAPASAPAATAPSESAPTSDFEAAFQRTLQPPAPLPTPEDAGTGGPPALPPAGGVVTARGSGGSGGSDVSPMAPTAAQRANYARFVKPLPAPFSGAYQVAPGEMALRQADQALAKNEAYPNAPTTVALQNHRDTQLANWMGTSYPGTAKALAQEAQRLNGVGRQLQAGNDAVKRGLLGPEAAAQLQRQLATYQGDLSAFEERQSTVGNIVNAYQDALKQRGAKPLHTGPYYPEEATMKVSPPDFANLPPSAYGVGQPSPGLLGGLPNNTFGKVVRGIGHAAGMMNPFAGMSDPDAHMHAVTTLMAAGVYPELPALPGKTPEERRQFIDQKNQVLWGLDHYGDVLNAQGGLDPKDAHRYQPVRDWLNSMTPWQKQVLPILRKQQAAERVASFMSGEVTSGLTMAATLPIMETLSPLVSAPISRGLQTALRLGESGPIRTALSRVFSAISQKTPSFLLPVVNRLNIPHIAEAGAHALTGGTLAAPISAGLTLAQGGSPGQAAQSALQGFKEMGTLGGALGMLGAPGAHPVDPHASGVSLPAGAELPGPRLTTADGTEVRLREHTPDQLTQIAQRHPEIAPAIDSWVQHHEAWHARRAAPLPVEAQPDYAAVAAEPGNRPLRQADGLRAAAGRFQEASPELAGKLTRAATELQQDHDTEFRERWVGENAPGQYPVAAPVEPPQSSAWREMTPEERAIVPPAVKRTLLEQDLSNSARVLDPAAGFDVSGEAKGKSAFGLQRMADQRFQDAQAHLENQGPRFGARGATAAQPVGAAVAAPVAEQTDLTNRTDQGTAPGAERAPEPARVTQSYDRAAAAQGVGEQGWGKMQPDLQERVMGKLNRIHDVAEAEGRAGPRAAGAQMQEELLQSAREYVESARNTDARRSALEALRQQMGRDVKTIRTAPSMDVRLAPVEELPAKEMVGRVGAEKARGVAGEPAADRTDRTEPTMEAAAGYSGPERRTDAVRRKTVAEMSEGEAKQALHTDELTGLGNGRAYREGTKRAHQAAIDVDGLKWANDTFGHPAGDVLLQVAADALKGAGADAYHVSGDEFVAQHDDPRALARQMAAAKKALAQTEFIVPTEGGGTKTLKGASFGHAIAEANEEVGQFGEKGHKPAYGDADAALQRVKAEAKAAREAAGATGDERGAQPSGLAEVAARRRANRLQPADDRAGTGRNGARGAAAAEKPKVEARAVGEKPVEAKPVSGKGMAALEELRRKASEDVRRAKEARDQGRPEARRLVKVANQSIAEVKAAQGEAGAQKLPAAVESGSKGGLQVGMKNSPAGAAHTFDDPKLNAEFEKNFRPKYASEWDRAKDTLVSLKNALTRHFEHLPETPQNKEFSEHLKLLQKRSIPMEKTIRNLRQVVRGMTVGEHDLYSRTLFLRDRAQEITRGREVSGGWDGDAVDRNLPNLEDAFRANPKLVQADQVRNQIKNDLVTEYRTLKKAVTGHAPDLSLDDYFHHWIMEYADGTLPGSGGGGGDIKAKTLGASKARSGSELSYVTSYVDSEGHWMEPMLREIQALKMFKYVKENGDKYPEVAARMKATGKTLSQVLREDDYRGKVAEFQPDPSSPLYRAFTIPERVMNEIANNGAALIDGGDIREKLFLGPQRKPMVIPQEWADTLNHFSDEQPRSPIGRAYSRFNTGFRKFLVLNPLHVAKFIGSRKFVTDVEATYFHDPALLAYRKQAGADLWGYLFRGKDPSPALERWLDAGGAHGALGALETIGEGKGLDALSNTVPPGKINPFKVPAKMMDTYFSWAERVTHYVDAYGRYMDFLRHETDMTASGGTPKTFGFSDPAGIMAIGARPGGVVTPEAITMRAYRLAEDRIGAYDSTSAFMRGLTRRQPVFGAWTEVAMHRLRQGVENAWQEPRMLAQVHNWSGGRLAGAYLAQAAKLTSWALMTTALTHAWNRYGPARENDDLLPDRVRAHPHMTLPWKSATGEVMAVDSVGAISEVLSNFGMGDTQGLVKGLLNREIGAGDIPRLMGMSAAEKWQQWYRSPERVAWEAFYGRTAGPENRPRAVRDQFEHWFSTMGMSPLYHGMLNAAARAGAPVKPIPERPREFYDRPELLGVSHFDPGEPSYQDMRQHALDWLLKNTTKQVDPAGQGTLRSNALYWATRAAKVGDADGVRSFLFDYVRAGGSPHTWLDAAKRLDPLGDMRPRERERYLETLSPRQQTRLATAYTYWAKFMGLNELDKRVIPDQKGKSFGDWVDAARSSIREGLPDVNPVAKLEDRNPNLQEASSAARIAQRRH